MIYGWLPTKIALRVEEQRLVDDSRVLSYSLVVLDGTRLKIARSKTKMEMEE